MTQEGALNEDSGKPVQITNLQESWTGTNRSTLHLYKATEETEQKHNQLVKITNTATHSYPPKNMQQKKTE